MSAEPQQRDAMQATTTLTLPPERAWQFLTEAQHLGQWFAEYGVMTPQTGGAFRFGGKYTPPNAPSQVVGEIVLAHAPQALHFTWPLHDHATEVCMDITAVEAGSRLGVSHSGLAIPAARISRMDLATQMECFWGNVLGNLRNIVDFGEADFRLDYAPTVVPTGIIEEAIDIRASPARIWRALTDPAELNQWIAVAAQVDLRPGGTYSFGWGDAVGFPIAIIALDPPHRLVHSWDDAGNEERVTWTLTPLGDRATTRLTVRHEVRDPANSEEYRVGWPGFLNTLWHRLAQEAQAGGALDGDRQPV